MCVRAAAATAYDENAFCRIESFLRLSFVAYIVGISVVVVIVVIRLWLWYLCVCVCVAPQSARNLNEFCANRKFSF